MLTYLEHVGIVSIFEKEMADAERNRAQAVKNSELKDQSVDYRKIQAARAAEYSAQLQALRWSLDQVRKIKHEYA